MFAVLQYTFFGPCAADGSFLFFDHTVYLFSMKIERKNKLRVLNVF